MAREGYPWVQVVSDDTLEQGDIICDCPILTVPSDLNADHLDMPGQEMKAEAEFQRFDVVLMSQSCDMVKGREKLGDILLCPLYQPSDFAEGEPLSKIKNWEGARKGRYPAYHVINACNIPDHASGFRIVSFRETFSLPVGFLRELAVRRGERLRLLPPYREHLSQAFARFFMRVGLPVDIPQFK